MGFFSFVRNITIGKPDPGEIALQWYWFEFIFWQNNFLTAGEFDLPMLDEDLEMTERVNVVVNKELPAMAGRMPGREKFVRSKRIAHGPGAVFAVFFTANSDDPRIYMPLTIHMMHHLKANMNFIDRVAHEYGMRVTSESVLLSQFKPSSHSILFENPFMYYRLQTEAQPENLLKYKVPGKREQIRQGFFDFMCTRDVQVAVRRVTAGEAAYIVPRDTYYTFEGLFKEGRSPT